VDSNPKGKAMTTPTPSPTEARARLAKLLDATNPTYPHTYDRSHPGHGLLADIRALLAREEALVGALRLASDTVTAAIEVASQARDEWDVAPAGMKAGKLLIALAGELPKYRPDIDAIHANRAKIAALLNPDPLPETSQPPPPPPWPAGPAHNAKREGWKAFFDGRARDAAIFPGTRLDLARGFAEGWDAASSQVAETAEGDA
jgi:hypothetical protein